MQKHFLLLASMFMIGCILPNISRAEVSAVASTEYVKYIVEALDVPTISSDLTAHLADTSNPHNVTKEQIGLEYVQNVDQTNADNLASGTVNIARLPVGMAENTIASGADSRFDTVSTAEPTGTPPDGRVFVWFD